MTRLVTSDIDTITIRMNQYDENFKMQVGCSMVEAAKRAVGLTHQKRQYKAAVVPVTSGLGIIDGFSRTVSEILQFCGIQAYVTKGTDVAGLQEAYIDHADFVFMADDDICSAFSIQGGVYSDNGYATGIGFAQALICAGQKRNDVAMKVLVLGAGPVGTAAAKHISDSGIDVCVYDIDKEKADRLVGSLKHGIYWKADMQKSDFTYILDATPVADVIDRQDVTKDTVIAAPGMPLGVTKEACEVATVIHNPLELGIIAMYYHCVKQIEE